jgi:hypothetical protein
LSICPRGHPAGRLAVTILLSAMAAVSSSRYEFTGVWKAAEAPRGLSRVTSGRTIMYLVSLDFVDEPADNASGLDVL